MNIDKWNKLPELPKGIKVDLVYDEDTWKLDIETKTLLRNIFTVNQAERYIHIIELRNQGMSFREIARERGSSVSSVYTSYQRVTKMFELLTAYFAGKFNQLKET
jgi:hypothetical protein